MNFQVPQFIEVEDKIFGPLTFKQFIYLAGGAGGAFLAYAYLPFYLAVIPMMAIAAGALGLAFYKVNNRPLIFLAEAATRYLANHKLYLWKKTNKKIVTAEALVSAERPVLIPKLSQSKLKDLSWSLDVHEKIN